ncbi:L,D-transpeptidase family protein [Corallococcus sp. bb12-1]|uniref:L,D-transpeptidase family protein n=1 Tax=Corallococcus sp. bb12-1 TaxID=2996784 RepID=UPI00226DC93A|nr:L,D-transpeptidase family protein [Corallococcus sp. bb12-1]MCY1042476.1 L,D-transpeptidase family protein [Corallococcus sp. bb12-1]
MSNLAHASAFASLTAHNTLTPFDARVGSPRASAVAGTPIPTADAARSATADDLRSATTALLEHARTAAATVPTVSLEHARFTGSPQLADVATGAAVLGTGSRGDGLRAVQGALMDMGFALYGGADGRYGPDTTRALRNFQVHAASAGFPGVRTSGVLDAVTLRALEALAPAPGSRGQTRALPSPFYAGQPVRVVIALREHRTFLFDPEGQLLDIFPNAVGTAATPTHPGLKVVRAKLDQVATENAGARLWNDGHVFGARLLDLSWVDGHRSGEELHGTSAPALLGGDVSHGCIRHANEDILVLHDALAVGDRIAVVETLQDAHLGVPVTVG